MKMIKFLGALILALTSYHSFSQGGVSCGEMAPICTDQGLNFTANSGSDEASTLDPGNDYDCLFSQPNPTWYYFQIATDGDLIMSLTAASDIDYAIWGPFTSLSVAQAACGAMGDQAPPNPDNGNLIDCSFSATNMETPTITGALTGQVYVMLITNYAGVVQNITLDQTGGTASTDCNIVTNPPCAITALNASISGCDFSSNNYEITGSVDLTDPPASGDLVIEDCDGNVTVIASAPFNATSYNFTISSLPANGNACIIQTYFTTETTCSQSMNYVAPACISNCPSYDLQASSATEACGNQMYWLEIENSGCNGFVSFDVVGNYGSLWANEISWSVVSNTTGNIVAQGGPGSDGGAINVTVGPLDPAVEGTVYTLEIVDVFGDGFNGTGGFIEIQENGNVLTNSITTFTTSSMLIVQTGIVVSSSTLSVITPSGVITNVTSNCIDHEIGLMLNNTNFCTPIAIDLPWSITCDLTGGLIASGIQTVTVFPQVPSAANDLVLITWNSTSCSWDVTPNNDCTELDIGTLFTITPDASTLGPYCSNGTESFSVSYLGFNGAPNCCSTAGPVSPITYTDSQTMSNAVAIGSPFGGVNNAALITVPGLGIGGNATSASITIALDGYCFDPPSTQTDDSYWVTIYVDGVIIYDQQHFDPPGAFNQTFSLANMPNGYNENSIIEVYAYPNSFNANGVNTTFTPGASCPSPGDGIWTMNNISTTFTATYEQTSSTPVNCDFSITSPYTCCTTTPLSATAPANQSFQCLTDVPASNVSLVTNVVSDCPVLVTHEDDTQIGSGCPFTIERRYRITDDCGTFIFVTQTFTIEDTIPPFFSAPPFNTTVECVGDIPVMTDLAWTDNCDGTGTVTGTDGLIIGGNCGGTVTRTWTHTDVCGNISTVTQTITIDDTTAPVLAAVPANIIVECVGDIPAMIDLAWTDNCDGTGTVTGTDGLIIGGNCGGTVTRTWTHTDVCGNISTVTQTITIDDTTAPVLAAVPANIIVECVGDIPAMIDLAWTDNCDGTGTVTGTDGLIIGGNCGGTITRTWTYTDVCGNVSTVTQTITIDDTTNPTASNLAPINLAFPPASTPDVNAVTDEQDNCTVNPIVAFVSDVSDGGSCPETITRTYSITDDCENQILVTQLIVIGGGLVPEPTVSANGPLCEGEDAIFTIDGLAGATVTYDIGQGASTTVLSGGTSIITVPSASTDVTITLLEIADGSCVSIINVSAVVVVNLQTTPSFTQLGTYCEGDTPGLLSGTSLEGITGTWSPTTISTTAGGTITYSFTNDAGQCALGTTMDVEIIAPTLPAFTQIAPICLNAASPTLPVTSDNGITGTWSPSVINTSASGPSTYTFTPDLGLCATITTMDLEIADPPLIDAGTNQIINCISNIGGAQIGSSPILGNIYSWTPASGLSDAGAANPIANPTGTTTYTLTVTNTSGCSSFAQVNVSLDLTAPVIGITNNTGTNILTCTLLDINLTATGAASYSWDNGLGNIDAANITSPGIYTVTGTGPNGCEATEQIEIIQDNGVDLFLVLIETEICSGEEVLIQANSSEATSFDWSVVQNGVAGGTDGTIVNTGAGVEIIQVLTATGASNGTVDYTITPTLGGCMGEPQTVTVTVLAPLTPSFTTPGPFCLNDTPTALTLNSLENISGSWSPSLISTSTAGVSSYVFTPNPGQCALTQSIDITVNALPVVDFTGENLIGCAPSTATLTSLFGSGLWTISNGVVLTGNSVTVTVNTPGCYDVTLQIEENGCTNSLTTPNYICVEEDPIADFSATPDLFTDVDATISFTNLSSGATSFIWSFGDGNSSTYINPSNFYESTEEGALITLTAISDFGCTDEAQLIIEYDEQEIFYVPNSFTPDGDNFNQVFTPVFYSGFDPYNFEMLIFNRWGQVVFETHDADIGWDGTYGLKGTKASDGAYTWKIIYKTPKTDERKVLVGHVTLIR